MSRTFRDIKNRKHPKSSFYKWWDKDPKLWRKIHKHRKRRLSQRELLLKVRRGEVEQVWPVDSKPRVWYW